MRKRCQSESLCACMRPSAKSLIARHPQAASTGVHVPQGPKLPPCHGHCKKSRPSQAVALVSVKTRRLVAATSDSNHGNAKRDVSLFAFADIKALPIARFAPEGAVPCPSAISCLARSQPWASIGGQRPRRCPFLRGEGADFRRTFGQRRHRIKRMEQPPPDFRAMRVEKRVTGSDAQYVCRFRREARAWHGQDD